MVRQVYDRFRKECPHPARVRNEPQLLNLAGQFVVKQKFQRPQIADRAMYHLRNVTLS